VSASGSTPSLDDADGFRTGVELQGLDDPSSGSLVGEFVDLESPFDPNPPVRDPDGEFDLGRGEDGFEAVMAYFWIDRAQRLIQDVGFDGVRDESFPVVPLLEEEVDNAFFDPARDAIFLGVGSQGRPDAGEDAQVIIHEYGHAVLHEQTPNLIFSDSGGAYHEAFGDVLAGLLTLGLSEDPACLFPWFLGDFGPDGCGRRFDTDKVFPDDLVNEVHLDGEIYTGAVFDVLEALLDAEGLTLDDCVASTDCDDVRDRVLALTLGTNEFLTGAEDLPEIAQAFVLANEAGFDGAEADAITAAFAAHGLKPGGDGVVDEDGVPTGEVVPVAAAVDISHPFRGDLAITLSVVDSSFDDLCTPISLLEPSGDGADNVQGSADISDTDCAELVPPSPDRQWVLHVEDTAAADVGQVNGFAVLVEGVPFLATGVPAPIADDDPTGTDVIVNGTGTDVPQEGTEEPGDAGAGVPFVSLAISHAFVGDLQVRAGVADPSSGDVLCSVPVLEPDPQDSSDDVSGEVDMSACASFFPPSAGAAWFLEVVDVAALDEGTIDRFELFGPDGTLVGSAAGVPIDIPDDDPGGAVALVLA
jgi:subtilisin-like proprotein convertase family protein